VCRPLALQPNEEPTDDYFSSYPNLFGMNARCIIILEGTDSMQAYGSRLQITTNGVKVELSMRNYK